MDMNESPRAIRVSDQRNSNSASGVPTYLERLYRVLLRGGRLTKYKGITGSVAPNMSGLAVAVSQVALCSGMALGALVLSPAAMAGTCTASATSVCSGPADPATDTTVILDHPAPLTVTTDPNFGIHTKANRALVLRGTGGMSFVQSGTGPITGKTDGVYLENRTSGDLSFTAAGDITGEGGKGIDVVGGAGTGNVSVAVGSVRGSTYGIYATSSGTGTLRVASTGKVVSDTINGIEVISQATTGQVEVNVNEVDAGDHGIVVTHFGTGSLNITATGLIHADTDKGGIGIGISAANTVNGKDITIDVADINAGQHGVYVFASRGSGGLNITTGDIVSGGNGIYTDHLGTGTEGTTVAVGAITSGGDGINVQDWSAGAINITATGKIDAKGVGIFADNTSSGTDINITATDVVAVNHGVWVFASDGTGGLNIKADSITSTGGSGIHADNTTASTTGTKVEVGTIQAAGWGVELQDWSSGGIDVKVGDITSGNDGITVDNFYNAAGTIASGTTIVVNSVTAGGEGIDVRDYSQGSIDITATGKVTATGGAGILAELSSNGADVRVDAQDDVSGTNWGIWALNHGTTGSMTIDSRGLASGGATDGIRADHAGNGLVINAENTKGGNFGIYVPSVGTGGLDITSTGKAWGVTDDGIYVSSNNNSTYLNLTVNDAQGARHGITTIHHSDVGTPGNDATINVSGTIQGGGGYGIWTESDGGVMTRINIADTATVQSTAGNAVFNDDGDSITTVAGGATVAGQFQLGSGDDDLTFNGTDLSNITVLNGGDDTIENANGIDRLSLNGTSATMTGSQLLNWEQIHVNGGTLDLTGTLGVGVLDIADGAVLSIGSGVVGDTLTVNGNFNGSNGRLLVDVDFATDTSDVLVVNGNVSGSTAIGVNNLSTGAATSNDVLVVDISGISPSNAFALANGLVDIGGVRYELVQNGNDWFLAALSCPASATTVGGSASAVLGCVPDEEITIVVGGDIANDVEGAGGRDIIDVVGDAAVAGIVRGGGAGADASAADDGGDWITIDTTGTVGGVEGNLGDDQIWILGGTVLGNVEGNEDNDTIVLNGANAVVAGAIDGGNGNDTLHLLAGSADNVLGGAGNDEIVLDGAAVAGAIDGGAGNDTLRLLGGSVDSVLGGADNDEIVLDGAAVAGAIDGGVGNDTLRLLSGSADSVLGGAGNDAATWNAGNASVGSIQLGDGSDTLLVSNGGAGLGTTVLDGGDDASSADGMVDVLTLSGVTHTVIAGQIVNWETINLTGSKITADGTLTAENVNLTGGSTLDGLQGLVINGNLAIANPGSTFVGTGGGAGDYRVTGNLANAGAVTLQDGAVGDVLHVGGNYSGNGQLLVDVDFANDSADRLKVGGNVTGSTSLVVRDASLADATGNDIVVVEAGGSVAPGSFSLANGPINSGVWTYDLVMRPQQVLLSGDINAIGAVYESAASNFLGAFGILPTLERRVGQRHWLARNPGELKSGGQMEGVWVRVHGDKATITPERSFAGQSSERSSWGIQAGLDVLIAENDSGHWIVGLTGQYGQVETDVSNALGKGAVDGTSHGLGLTATWHGEGGTYFDAQAQYNRVSMDFAASPFGQLASGQDGTVQVLSAELGHHVGLGGGKKHLLVPQGQLNWSRLNADVFTDSRGNTVDISSGEQLTGRLGLAYQYRPDSDGVTRRDAGERMFYVIGNLLQDFSGADRATVSATTLDSRGQRSWAELGLGGSMLLGDSVMLYGEGAYRTSVSGDASGNDGFSATLGLRVNW